MIENRPCESLFQNINLSPDGTTSTFKKTVTYKESTGRIYLQVDSL